MKPRETPAKRTCRRKKGGRQRQRHSWCLCERVNSGKEHKEWCPQQEGWKKTCKKRNRSLFKEEKGVSLSEGIHAPFKRAAADHFGSSMTAQWSLWINYGTTEEREERRRRSSGIRTLVRKSYYISSLLDPTKGFNFIPLQVLSYHRPSSFWDNRFFFCWQLLW